jgi:hypothetical protein
MTGTILPGDAPPEPFAPDDVRAARAIIQLREQEVSEMLEEYNRSPAYTTGKGIISDVRAVPYVPPTAEEKARTAELIRLRELAEAMDPEEQQAFDDLNAWLAEARRFIALGFDERRLMGYLDELDNPVRGPGDQYAKRSSTGRGDRVDIWRNPRE